MKDKSSKLTPKQQRFVEEYLVDFNATAAYQRAGYAVKKPGVAAVESHRMLKKANVQSYIVQCQEALKQRTDITVERVLAEYAKIAFADLRKLYDDDGNLLPIHKIDDDTAGALSAIEIEELKNGEDKIGITKKIKVTDKRAALDSIAKHLGMFVEKHEHKGPGKDGAFIVQISQPDEDI